MTVRLLAVLLVSALLVLYASAAADGTTPSRRSSSGSGSQSRPQTPRSSSPPAADIRQDSAEAKNKLERIKAGLQPYLEQAPLQGKIVPVELGNLISDLFNLEKIIADLPSPDPSLFEECTNFSDLVTRKLPEGAIVGFSGSEEGYSELEKSMRHLVAGLTNIIETGNRTDLSVFEEELQSSEKVYVKLLTSSDDERFIVLASNILEIRAAFNSFVKDSEEDSSIESGDFSIGRGLAATNQVSMGHGQPSIQVTLEQDIDRLESSVDRILPTVTAAPPSDELKQVVAEVFNFQKKLDEWRESKGTGKAKLPEWYGNLVERISLLYDVLQENIPGGIFSIYYLVPKGSAFLKLQISDLRHLMIGLQAAGPYAKGGVESWRYDIIIKQLEDIEAGLAYALKFSNDDKLLKAAGELHSLHQEWTQWTGIPVFGGTKKEPLPRGSGQAGPMGFNPALLRKAGPMGFNPALLKQANPGGFYVPKFQFTQPSSQTSPEFTDDKVLNPADKLYSSSVESDLWNEGGYGRTYQPSVPVSHGYPSYPTPYRY